MLIRKTAKCSPILMRLQSSGGLVLSVYRAASDNAVGNIGTVLDYAMKADAAKMQFARCYSRLADLSNFALDRLSRYEATLWRQAGHIL